MRLFWLFFLIAASITSVLYAEEFIVPSDLIKLSPKQGTQYVEGYVTGHVICPPCPTGALCKPCPPKAFFFSDKKREQALLNGVNLPDDTIVVRCSNPERFEFGKKYQIELEVSDVHATRYKIDGFELKETR